jgi:hypothetical protein
MTRLNRILNVHREQRRRRCVVKDEWRRSRVCKSRVAEARFTSLTPVRDVKGEVFAQVQPRGLGSGLQHMRTEMVRHAGERANTPQAAIGVGEQRRIAWAADERCRSQPMVARDLRDRVRAPRLLPRYRLPRLAIALALVLLRPFLFLIVRNVEIGAAEAGDRIEHRARRNIPAEFGAAVQRSAVVMQIVRVHGIEKSV